MTDTYDRSGKPITTDEWASMSDQRGVAHDSPQPPKCDVSTVWLGLNHRFGDGPPLIFETMVFGGQHDGYCERYETESEAEAGHRRVVENIAAGRHPEWEPDQ